MKIIAFLWPSVKGSFEEDNEIHSNNATIQLHHKRYQIRNKFCNAICECDTIESMMTFPRRQWKARKLFFDSRRRFSKAFHWTFWWLFHSDTQSVLVYRVVATWKCRQHRKFLSFSTFSSISSSTQVSMAFGIWRDFGGIIAPRSELIDFAFFRPTDRVFLLTAFSGASPLSRLWRSRSSMRRSSGDGTYTIPQSSPSIAIIWIGT